MPDDTERLLQEFQEADENYHALEKCLLEGEFIPDNAVDGSLLKDQLRHLVEELKRALEERNVKLKNAQDALRQKVALAPSRWRGPEGKPDVLTTGSFIVSSVTYRGFDPKSLFDLCQKHGVYERLMELKTLDKDGKEKNLVEQQWDIDYAGILRWLKANQMQDVIDGAYDEKEGTPQVKGPKPLAFLGDKKEK
jgi:hypothetical protein